MSLSPRNIIMSIKYCPKEVKVVHDEVCAEPTISGCHMNSCMVVLEG